MRKITVIIMLLLSSSVLVAQTLLVIEGTVVNNTQAGTWTGVNITRNQPTAFAYRNNSITSVNSQGYMLQAGDESPGSTNNNLDGEIITGNKFVWNGIDVASTITHVLFVGYNKNYNIKYNYIYRGPTAMVLKSNGITNTSGGVAYNIINRTGCIGMAVKGMNGVLIYNNTFYSNEVRWTNNSSPGTDYGLVDIFANDGLSPWVYSTGTKIKNNIFYTVNNIHNISIQEAQDLVGFESDYNIFWCESGTPVFRYLGNTLTFAQWQALGYDTHSRIINPNFNNISDFVPAARLDYGTNLGSTWQTGLSTSAVWTVGSAPATTNQNGPWQVGARIFSSQVIPVSSISVTGAGNETTITTDNGSLQLSAEVLPVTATEKKVTWSVINEAGRATINSTGLLTAVDNGTVTARATAVDGSGIYGTLVITISNQIVPVTNINVTGFGGASIITTNNGSLQTFASVLPSNATNKDVTWSVINGTGQATINGSGLVTAISEGIVTAVATANDGSGVHGDLVITISTSLIPVTGIVVTGAGGISQITTDNGSLQLSAAVLPVDATIKNVTWSITNGTGLATISATGLVTAVDNGTVIARANSTDGSGVYGNLVITISNQVVAVTNISVTGSGGATSITKDDGTLQLNATVLPADATDKTVSWSIVNGTGQATISSAGLVTAIRNGTVTAMATANDGSGINGSLIIAISNQRVPVTGIIITGTGGATSISTDNGSLQLSEAILPTDATDKTVTWSIVNGTGQAAITSAGLVTAVKNGTVTARATANDGSGEFGTLVITISNQIEPVTGITVTGSGGATTITTDNGSLQLIATVLPADATDNTVIWSIVNGTSLASISTSGLLTAIDNGNVTVRATAHDGSGVYGTLVINTSNQIIPVTGISVSGAGGINSIITDDGSLQMSAAVLPANASDKTITWSLVNGSGRGTINSTGLVTAIDNGTVTAIATANDGSGVVGTRAITISNQIVPVTTITVTSPNGGENWQVGSIHNITWTSVGNSGTVRIEYSTNNGLNWTGILASTPDDGSESWTIPNTPATICLVRVSDTDGSPVDVSNIVFSINPASGVCYNETFMSASGTITDNSGASNYLNNMTCEKLIQPSGGGIITLTFTAFNTEAGYDFVRVYNGSTTSAPLLGTFSGNTLPAVLTAGSGSMLIRFTTDGSVVAAGWSANYTSVVPPVAITVTSPNGGEAWQAGSSHNITWTSYGTSGTVRIEYSTNNGTSWASIIASTPDDGTQTWTIPNTLSTTCLIRVSDTDGSPVDVSNAVFSITAATGGACINETFTSSSGTITDNSGASNYLNNMTCEKLIQPSGGGIITLTFTAFNTEAGYDFVRVYNGSTTSAPLLGTFSGNTLPPVLTAGSGSMLIRFTTDGSVVAAGWSANYTSVVPPVAITVTSPNGGEVWQVGSSHDITWTSYGTSGTVSIEYSTNNGTSWASIFALTPDDGTQTWTIPNTLSTTCLIRVSDTDGSPVDVSNAVFSITAATGGTCVNETFTSSSGTVTDNSGASNYLNNMTCEKLIQPSGGGTITLTFTAFNTEAWYDFVRVYNGSTTSAPLLGTFSGTTLPAVLTAGSGSMLIRFTSDGSVVAAGWSATYNSSVPGGTKGSGQINKNDIIIETENSEKELVVYPNPTSGILTIESSFKEEETYTIDLINSSGQVVLNQIINVIGGKFDLDISNVSYGLYFLKIRTEKTVRLIRVIKN